MWAKRLSYGSDKVLSSLSYLYSKLNGKRVSDQRLKCWNSQYELIIHVISIFVSNLVFSLVFWTTLPASRGLYSMKKPREFVHNKCKAFFIISWPFWTNIEYSHRVPTLIFLEIIVWELIDTSQWRNIKIFWYAQARQFPPQKSKIIIEITWHF